MRLATQADPIGTACEESGRVALPGIESTSRGRESVPQHGGSATFGGNTRQKHRTRFMKIRGVLHMRGFHALYFLLGSLVWFILVSLWPFSCGLLLSDMGLPTIKAKPMGMSSDSGPESGQASPRKPPLLVTCGYVSCFMTGKINSKTVIY